MVVLFNKKAVYHVFLPLFLFLVIFSGDLLASSRSANVEQAREYFNKGQYTDCIETIDRFVAFESTSANLSDQRALKAQALMVLGRYDDAAEELERALIRDSDDMRLLNLLYEASLYNRQEYYTPTILERVYNLATTTEINRWSPPELAAMGRLLLKMNFDPRSILEQVYGYAVQRDPNCRDAYIAMGDLALEKQDYELAADQFRAGLSRFGDDPDMHCGLARAFYSSNRIEMLKSLDAAFSINPDHPSSWLLLAEHQIDCEEYEAAEESLGRIFEVNPKHPQAWAFNCVLAYIANNTDAMTQYRNNALQSWQNNPYVDYLIGKKLSLKYRFAEAAQYQRQSLEFDPDFLPAKIQLAQDLLRLGLEDEGWALAEEVFSRDKYNIQAYNLVSLHDHMSTFETLQDGRFIVRMDKTEAAIYGRNVLELMGQAATELSQKYGLESDSNVILELFPNQQDFAIRTFGIPGGDGFLGVCFGNVITANSPKLAHISNWQAMIWHEVCHVVTLNLTHNKMPRWLSEGISVYEESQKNPLWGRKMTTQYRNMILEGEYYPISELSAAFLSPPSAEYLMFAYYQSSMVVKFLVDQYGYDSLRAILASLAEGMEINQALSEHAAPVRELDREFSSFIREQAQELASDIDWEQPEDIQSVAGDPEALSAWLNDHPNSYWALTYYALSLITEQQWQEAIEPLNKMVELYPDYTGQNNPYQLLAQVYRGLGQTEQEQKYLGILADLSAEAIDVYERLMEIAVEQENWQQVIENGQKYFAVYPLPASLHRRLATANEKLGNDIQAIETYKRLLALDPVDPVDVNYRLAKLLAGTEPQQAKRYVLTALSEAPRFRDAHSLLLELIENEQDTPEVVSGGNPIGNAGGDSSINNMEVTP